MSQTRKFFLGVVPEGLEENAPLKVLLGKMKRTLRERSKEARWAPSELWHVTLLFFGHLSDDKLAVAREALESWVPPAEKVHIGIAGLGAFPDSHEARVLWLGVQKTQELLSFRRGLVSYMTDQGVGGTAAVEDAAREFVPHLTLARLRNLQSIDDLVRLGGRKSIGEYKIKEVVLFESVIQGNIKKYVPIARRTII